MPNSRPRLTLLTVLLLTLPPLLWAGNAVVGRLVNDLVPPITLNFLRWVLAFVLFFLISFVVDLHAPVFWSAIAEAVDYGESKTGQRVAGLSFGGISFCQKAGMGVAGAMVGWMLAGFGYQPDVAQTELALTGIALMLTIIPGVFHYLVGALMQTPWNIWK